jgi:uncharacterized membrane protein
LGSSVEGGKVETVFLTLAGDAALLVEGAAVLIVLGAAIEALVGIAAHWFASGDPTFRRRAIWSRFARWLVLALEFTLAADIVRTAISPTWSDIGQLGAIALIRTFLSYFLERDLVTMQQSPTSDRG